MSDTLEAALRYRELGLSVVPILAGDKRAAVKWQPFQERLPTEAELRRWFGAGDLGIAVVCGQVSGNLAVRDFDRQSAFEAWAWVHSDLAGALPIVKTARGRHVYARTLANAASDVRTTSLGDGELRGEGSYVVAPPSVHPAGGRYAWVVPLGSAVPVVDLAATGLGELWHEAGAPHEVTVGAVDSVVTVDSVGRADIAAAIDATQPTDVGQRHRSLFDLGRRLKALLPGTTLAELRPIVEAWHHAALPIISTKPFDDTWFDFGDAWHRIKYPAGCDPIGESFARAVEAEPPACAGAYDSATVKLLVCWCRGLQRLAGAEPFYLASRTAAEYLGADRAEVSRWLRGLVRDGVLALVERGTRHDGRASTYRYLGD